MQFRQFTSIQVALGAYVYICLLALCHLDAWMDGYSKWMDLCKYNHRYIDTLRHCRMSSSSFRWRLCSWERQWLKSSASCGHLSSVVDRTGAEVKKNHEQIQGPTARKAAQAEPAILSTTSHMIKPKRSQQEDTNNNYQISNNCTTASICLPSVSTLQTSFYLLLTLQNFTVRKSQHLQSGFRFLVSVRLFLQALLAICSFFRFCYSCMYCVRLGLQ